MYNSLDLFVSKSQKYLALKLELLNLQNVLDFLVTWESQSRALASHSFCYKKRNESP